MKPNAHKNMIRLMIWAFLGCAGLGHPATAVVPPPAGSLAPAVIEDPSSAVRNELISRIEFEELNLSLVGVTTVDGKPVCYLKHPGALEPMVYQPGDVIGGFKLELIEAGSVTFERRGVQFWLLPDSEVELAEEEAGDVGEVAEATVESAREALLEELAQAEAIQAPEIKTARLSLKSRTAQYESAKLIEDGSRTKALLASRAPAGPRFILPMSGKLTSSYGYRRHPMGGQRKFHHGVDLAAPHGSRIIAAAAGTVTRVSYNSLLGRYVIIAHSDGYETVYAHLSRQLVKAGQKVAQGQSIGEEGSTGLSTGPHLHFEIRRNGTSINPLNFVRPRR